MRTAVFGDWGKRTIFFLSKLFEAPFETRSNYNIYKSYLHLATNSMTVNIKFILQVEHVPC